MTTPNRSSPLSAAPSALSVTHLLRTIQRGKNYLVVLHVPVTDPTRQLHLWLRNRATPSLEVLFSSLCGSSRVIRLFWANADPSQEPELGCGYSFSDHAFFRRVRRSAENANLLKGGDYMHLMMLFVQGRVRALDLACSFNVPGSGDYVLTIT